ncbi:HPr family phosphocarrier protein [uncultured Tyzzerella sp.]|uniref:HPr family phosphocarrier protein n=1 Tax=uncultured Tyzzerella sp. TaxID=2321398 RepID=UPI002941E81A|nr:HPr family phosphocarrier protein [uncultured Tyzzerella sp.]
MKEQNLKITASIEAREVALIVQTASKFTSNIKIMLDDKKVNAKSIMGLIALGGLDGKDVTILAEGHDEEEAVKELSDFLTN